MEGQNGMRLLRLAPLLAGVASILSGGPRLAASPAVPPPWTPLEARGPTVRCWGRAYRASAGLPEQVVSQRVPLLAAPMCVRCGGESSRPVVAPFGRAGTREGRAGGYPRSGWWARRAPLAWRRTPPVGQA